jgi:diguanylate cyclase (GGDEF)-like protein/PAS domain S-box-containing protein
MQDTRKTKALLLTELTTLRQKVTELEESDAERRIAGKALKESEKKYRNFYEHAIEGIFQSTPEGRFLSVNPSLARMFGYASPEAMIKTVSDIGRQIYANPQDRLRLKELLVEQGRVEGFEAQVCRKDGKKMWVIINACAVRDPGGAVLYIEGTNEDITTRKQTEESIRESEWKYRSILENIDEGYYEVDLAGNFTFFNPSLPKILGYTAEEMKGMNNRQYMDGENAKKIFLAYKEVYRTGIAIKNVDWEFIRKDGNRVFMETSTYLMRDSSGQPIGFSGIIHDVSDRRRAEEALKAAEALYRTLAERSFVGVYVVQGGKFRFINSNAASYAGYTKEELLDQEAGQLIHPEDREKEKRNAQAMLRGESTSPYEFRIITKQGQTRWIMETVTSIYYHGKPAILGNSMDITERKRMEEEIIALTITDPLTGLHNRRGFFALAEQQLKIAERTKIGILLVFADMDGLKWINDHLGHQKGDEALAEAAAIFTEVFRDSDVIARVGGDEFVVLALGATLKNSDILESRLQQYLDKHNAREGRDFKISISVGIVNIDPQHPCSIEELLSHADALMYEQKKKKRAQRLQ